MLGVKENKMTSIEQEKPKGIEPEPISDKEKELFDLLTRVKLRGRVPHLIESLKQERAPEILMGGNAAEYSKRVEAGGKSPVTGERNTFIVVLSDRESIMPSGIITCEKATGRIFIGGREVDEQGFFTSSRSMDPETLKELKEFYLQGRVGFRPPEEVEQIQEKRESFLDELEYILEHAEKKSE